MAKEELKFWTLPAGKEAIITILPPTNQHFNSRYFFQVWGKKKEGLSMECRKHLCLIPDCAHNWFESGSGI